MVVRFTLTAAEKGTQVTRKPVKKPTSFKIDRLEEGGGKSDDGEEEGGEKCCHQLVGDLPLENDHHSDPLARIRGVPCNEGPVGDEEEGEVKPLLHLQVFGHQGHCGQVEGVHRHLN